MKIIMPMVLRHSLSPAGCAIACAHGALAGYLRWKAEPIVEQWVSSVFYKRIYQVTDLAMWRQVQAMAGALILTESGLDHLAVVAVFIPRPWTTTSPFNDLPLYTGAAQGVPL